MLFEKTHRVLIFQVFGINHCNIRDALSVFFFHVREGTFWKSGTGPLSCIVLFKKKIFECT